MKVVAVPGSTQVIATPRPSQGTSKEYTWRPSLSMLAKYEESGAVEDSTVLMPS